MLKRNRFLAMASILALSTAFAFSSQNQTSTPAQTTKKESKTARIIGTVLGGVGGFLLVASILDDDRNTTTEFYTALIIGPTAGAVGGYFIGRAIDRRHNDFAYGPDLLKRQELRDQMVEIESQRLRAFVRASAEKSDLENDRELAER